ncbi:MAG: N-acetylmuramoyl-L-alanine amidase family protein [Candidatus Hydrothermia bacterium]
MRSSKYCVVLDPGHGGSATGAVGPSGTLEKDLNLKLALILSERLSTEFDVLLTRDSDKDLSLEERVKIAESNNADIFISIHFNADPLSGNLNQTEIYTPFEEIGPSRDLGEVLFKNFKASFDIPCKAPQPSRYHVLRSKIPVRLLLEVSYLSNAEEEIRLKNEERLYKVASIIYDSLCAFTRKRISLYEGYELKGNEIRFKFNKEIDPQRITVLVDEEEVPWFQVKKKQIVVFTDFLRGGLRRFEIKGKAFDGSSFPHVVEEIEIAKEPYYFVATVLPYTGYQLVKLRVFDKSMNPIPPGIPLSFDMPKVTFRAKKRGYVPEVDYENLVRAKRVESDPKGSYAILLRGIMDEAQISFNVGSFSGKLVAENIPRRRSNILGFVYNSENREPLKGVKVISENGVDFTEEFGIFEIERHSEAESEKVVFSCPGFYPKEMELSTGKEAEVFLAPIYNGVLHGKRIFLDVDNRDFLDYVALRRSWAILENLKSLIISAGGEAVLLRNYVFKEVDDYYKVRYIMYTNPNISIQISNAKLPLEDGFYILYYERSRESLEFAEKIKNEKALKLFVDPVIKEAGNYFLIQSSGVRVNINSKGVFSSDKCNEDDLAKFVALKLFISILAHFGFSGVYFKEYLIDERLKEYEIVTEDFHLSFTMQNGSKIGLIFARPDTKIIIKKGSEIQYVLNKPLEGTCITLPDGS